MASIFYSIINTCRSFKCLVLSYPPMAASKEKSCCCRNLLNGYFSSVVLLTLNLWDCDLCCLFSSTSHEYFTILPTVFPKKSFAETCRWSITVKISLSSLFVTVRLTSYANVFCPLGSTGTSWKRERHWEKTLTSADSSCTLCDVQVRQRKCYDFIFPEL